MSSPRTRGPITTGPDCCEANSDRAPTRSRGVWVPAFAGTTMERFELSNSLTPSLRAQRSNPWHRTRKGGLLRCARNDDGGQFRILVTCLARPPPPAQRRGRDERSSLLRVGGGGSIRRNRCFGICRTTPHPRPLPATRDARGGRGARTPSRSRRKLLREVCLIPVASPPEKGAGNAGRSMRPRSRVQDGVEDAHEHTGHTGDTRHSPRNGFTDYGVLSPVLGLFGHRHP